MIVVSLGTTALEVGRSRGVPLVVTNTGPLPCSRIAFGVMPSRELQHDGGPRWVAIEVLAPGERVERILALRARVAGTHRITVYDHGFIEAGLSVEAPDHDLMLTATEPGTHPLRSPDLRPGVFLSYRRGDVDDVVAELATYLTARFDAPVFRDRSVLEPGDLFAARIDRELEASAVAIVVIGPRWTTGPFVDRRRLRERDDWVAREVAGALSGGVRTVIPALVGVTMPPPHVLPRELHGLLDRQPAMLSTTESGLLRPKATQALLETLTRYLAARPGRCR